MIVGIIGTFDLRMSGEMIKGNGKTLTMVYYLFQDFLKGRKVYMNNKTSFTTEIDTMEVFDLFRDPQLRDISIGFDEVQMSINSLATDPELIKEFCNMAAAQTRKKHVKMYWTAQRAMDVHKRLRIQTDVFLKPIRVHKDRRPCQRFDCNLPHSIAVLSFDPPRGRPIKYLNCKNVGKLYDTEEVITHAL